MINIISTFYISKYNSSLDNDRTNELCDAFINNLNSDIVKKIHVFVDDSDSLKKLNDITSKNENLHKIVIVKIKKQPTYHDFFNYILQKLPNNICMITNSDIYIHSYDINLIKLLNYNRYVYALTRYEHDMTPLFIYNFNGSHDCYIFNSKYLDNRIICENTSFKQNLLGIETRIIKSFYDLNYKIFNPCKQIKIVHLHKTNLRNYTELDDVALHNKDLELWKNSVWYTPPCILELNKKEGIIYCIINSNSNRNINNYIINKKYSWGDSYIKFLPNNKMNAFGPGNYKVIDEYNIIATFGKREHEIKFNNDYTEFTSIRKGDSCTINGELIYNIEYL